MEKPVIYINGNFLYQPVTGVQRFGHEIIKALDSLLSEPQDVTFVILTDRKNPGATISFKHIRVKKAGISRGKIWEQTDLAMYTAGKPLITFAGGAPIFKKNQYFTIHDAAIYDRPEGYSALYKRWYYTINSLVTKSAKHIITVSQFSKKRLAQQLQISPEKISVIHNAGTHITAIEGDETIWQALPAGKKYVLCVGSLHPNKNFMQVIQVAAALQHCTDIQFVVAGNTNNKVFQQSSAYADALALPNITYVGSVSDAALKTLYAKAACFLFLSVYEGFGIPVAEAMCCGCPVVCSNASCLPELFGAFACLVNPHDTTAIAAAVKNIVYDEEMATQLREKARKGAVQYSWLSSAKKLLQQVSKPSND